MVTVNFSKWIEKTSPYGKSTYYHEGECLSTDTKPVGEWYNGSKLIEMDTGKIFIYDAQNEQWREFT